MLDDKKPFLRLKEHFFCSQEDLGGLRHLYLRDLKIGSRLFSNYIPKITTVVRIKGLPLLVTLTLLHIHFEWEGVGSELFIDIL